MKMDRLRWLPASLSGLQFRVTAFVASIAMAIATIKTCSDALNSVGSTLLTPVGGLMKEGVYAYVRNPAHLGLVFVQMPMFGVLYDSAWPLLCTVVLFFYLRGHRRPRRGGAAREELRRRVGAIVQGERPPLAFVLSVAWFAREVGGPCDRVLLNCAFSCDSRARNAKMVRGLYHGTRSRQRDKRSLRRDPDARRRCDAGLRSTPTSRVDREFRSRCCCCCSARQKRRRRLRKNEDERARRRCTRATSRVRARVRRPIKEVRAAQGHAGEARRRSRSRRRRRASRTSWRR